MCSLHRGLVEGFVDEVGGGEVGDFRTLVDRDPCQVDRLAAAPIPAIADADASPVLRRPVTCDPGGTT